MVAVGRRSEFAIEFFLLLGREQGMNASARLQHLFVTLALEVLAQVHHLGAGFVYDLENLVVLRRRQIQLMLHPFDERLVWRAQQSVAVG
jgi:hypothetical protein